LAGYNNILKKEIISFPKKGAINLHGGKLPDYRGVAPINWQIIKGEKVGGCCIIFVDEGIDTGDIIEQEFYDIGENDTAGDVVQRQLEIFPPMLLKAVQNIEKGTVNSTKQDLAEGSYYTRRYPDDGRVDFASMTALDAHNMIRAMRGPYPPAFCFYNDKKIYLLGSELLKEKIIGTPGRIALKRPEGVIVIARDRGLLITEVSSSMEGPAQKVGDNLKTGNNVK
jgi:methionyl-tRNA formyltransferase